MICSQTDPIRSSGAMINLSRFLMNGFEGLFYRYHRRHSELIPSDLFTDDHAWDIVKNYIKVLNGKHLRGIMGSEPVEGTFLMIQEGIRSWKSSDDYVKHLDDIRRVQETDQRAYDAGTAILAAYEEDRRLKDEKKAEEERADPECEKTQA